MKTFCLYSNESIDSQFLASVLQGKVSSELTALEQVSEIGVWEWTVNSSLEDRWMMEHHQSMVRYHKGSKVFWYDGGTATEVLNRIFIGYGDGVTTDFLMPFRWMYKQSLVISINYSVTGSWTLNGRVLSFTSAPADKSMIHIDRAKMRFKAFLSVDSDKMYNITDNYKAYGSQNIKIREWAE